MEMRALSTDREAGSPDCINQDAPNQDAPNKETKNHITVQPACSTSKHDAIVESVPRVEGIHLGCYNQGGSTSCSILTARDYRQFRQFGVAQNSQAFGGGAARKVAR
jgi:hypothetical protein